MMEKKLDKNKPALNRRHILMEFRQDALMSIGLCLEKYAKLMEKRRVAENELSIF